MRAPIDRPGLMSLALFFLGLLLFLLDWLAVRFAAPRLTFRVFYGSLFVAVALEAAAVGFGLAAQRTVLGKAGLVLALLTLTLVLGFCCCTLPRVGWTGGHG